MRLSVHYVGLPVRVWPWESRKRFFDISFLESSENRLCEALRRAISKRMKDCPIGQSGDARGRPFQEAAHLPTCRHHSQK